jgi:hypothetical protein
MLAIQIINIQQLLHYNISHIHLVGFAITKSYLKFFKVFGKRHVTI